MLHYLGNNNITINNSIASINTELKKDEKERLNYVKQGNYVKRPIPSKTAEYYYDNNEALANVVDIKAEDIIKRNYISVESENNNPEIISFFEKLLNSNKKDFAFIIGDRTLYGAGAGEILTIDDSTVMVDHIPNRLLEIVIVKHEDIEYPLVEVRDYNNKVVGFNRLFHFHYPENFPTTHKNFELGDMFWFGGGQFNDFYDKPFYLQLVQEINSQIVVRELDTKTFNKGNQLSGIVYINKSGVQDVKPNPIFNSEIELNLEAPEDDEEPVTSPVLPQNVEILKKEINSAGFGNAIFYDETDDPMSMNYINLTNNNQDYIIKKLESYKTEVYRRAKIPKERLMDSSIKESQNSHKTVAIWTIYIDSLNASQQDLEQLTSDYLFFVYDEDLIIDISIPEFEEFKIARAQVIMDLFNNAGVTHENYVLQLNKIFEWVDIDNLNTWYSKEFFYKGRMLSDMVNNQGDDFETMIGDLFAESDRNR